MKNVKICTTTHEKGSHKLYIDSFQLLDCESEPSLVDAAKKLGIRFKDLDFKAISSNDREFMLTTEWYGTKETIAYLNWKGTIGAGLNMRKTVLEYNNSKEHNDAVASS